MDRIPIVQLVDGFATEEHAGGAAQFALRLALHLDRARFEPHVVGLWRYDTASERRWLQTLAETGIGTALLVEERQRLSHDLLRAAARLELLVRRRGVSVVNSHFERGDLLSMAVKLASSGLKIVRTQHTDQQWQKRPWLGSLLNTAAFPWLFDAEVAISAATRDALDRRSTSRFVGRRSSLIYNGLTPSALVQLARRGDPGLRNARAPKLAIIGRLEPQKGHSDVLDAFSQIQQSVPGAELWVVGHGDLQADLEQLARKLGPVEAMRFLGRRSDIAEILGRVDVLVSASYWEGFPTVILEAMAAGVPVVATDVSGSRELVREGVTGALVPVGDPPALAAAVLRMLSRPADARAMAERAQREVQRYSLDAIAEEYGQLYTCLLSR